jgi:hypothetical protein
MIETCAEVTVKIHSGLDISPVIPPRVLSQKQLTKGGLEEQITRKEGRANEK